LFKYVKIAKKLDLDVVKLFFSKGLKISDEDDGKRTVLHYSAMNENCDIKLLEYLME